MNLLTAARASGITLWVEGDQLRYRGHLSAELRAALAADRAAIIAALDQDAIIRELAEADNLPARLGVSGRHPAIAHAASIVGIAVAANNIPAVRSALAEFITVVEFIATARDAAIQRGAA
jgi:hypothetical protein